MYKYMTSGARWHESRQGARYQIQIGPGTICVSRHDVMLAFHRTGIGVGLPQMAGLQAPNSIDHEELLRLPRSCSRTEGYGSTHYSPYIRVTRSTVRILSYAIPEATGHSRPDRRRLLRNHTERPSHPHTRRSCGERHTWYGRQTSS